MIFLKKILIALLIPIWLMISACVSVFVFDNYWGQDAFQSEFLSFVFMLISGFAAVNFMLKLQKKSIKEFWKTIFS